MKSSFHMICYVAVDINCDVTAGSFFISKCISRRPGSLRVDAFRRHGLSLLALAKGMSALFAKNGFSRPPVKYCGVFGHVLFPQDKEGYDSFCIVRRKLVCIFEESPPFSHPD